jgi:hypothetical protein
VVTDSDDLTVLCVDPGTAARDRIVEAFEGRGDFRPVTADDVAELSTVEAFDRPSELIVRHLDIGVAFVGLLDEAEERFLACHGADWETLLLEPVSAGTSLLVTGPSLGGTRELVVGLLACQSGESCSSRPTSAGQRQSSPSNGAGVPTTPHGWPSSTARPTARKTDNGTSTPSPIRVT